MLMISKWVYLMSNKRVVITGYGIVSCIGNNKQEVLTSLKEVKSGISYCKEYEEMGMRSHVHGKPTLNIEENVDRKVLRRPLWKSSICRVLHSRSPISFSEKLSMEAGGGIHLEPAPNKRDGGPLP